MSQNQANLVPVYWCDDPILWSPCILGNPCGICVAHSVNRKMKTPCMKLRPVAPAYFLPIKSALAMVNEGTADLMNVLGYQCIRLTFSKAAQLRDQSCKTNEDILIRYAAGEKRAKASVDGGWDGVRAESSRASSFTDGNVIQVSTANWTPEMMAQSQERVQCFT